MTDIVERLHRGVDTNEPPEKTDAPDPPSVKCCRWWA